jgi:Putative zinc-finger
MNSLSFDSRRCELMRQYLDSYLSNELLVETASEVVRHLESCESCSRDLESRMRVRDALQRAVVNRPVPDSVRADVLRSLRESQPRSFVRPSATPWAIGLACIAFVLLSLFTAKWLSLRRGEQLVASILKLGVSDHIVCAIKGHNYPEVANPPDQIRGKLGVRYAVLLQVVQERLPGFEVLEGHICSIPGSNRKYIHFITRGQGTILSVILTDRNGASLPKGQLLASPESAGLSIYEGHHSGMEIAGFESAQYFAFVVSDLSQNQMLQLARGLAPALNETLQTAFQGLNSHVLNALFELRHVIPTSATTYSTTTEEALSQRPMRRVPTILDRQTMTRTICPDEKRCCRAQACQSDV